MFSMPMASRHAARSSRDRACVLSSVRFIELAAGFELRRADDRRGPRRPGARQSSARQLVAAARRRGCRRRRCDSAAAACRALPVPPHCRGPGCRDSLSQVAVEEGRQLSDLETAPTFWRLDLAVLEQHQGRDAADAVLHGGARVVVDVDLGDLEAARYSAAISSRIGAIILQGPHHSAQKSTSTGVADFSTSCSKVASVT